MKPSTFASVAAANPHSTDIAFSLAHNNCSVTSALGHLPHVAAAHWLAQGTLLHNPIEYAIECFRAPMGPLSWLRL